jgi:hypothetical protein
LNDVRILVFIVAALIKPVLRVLALRKAAPPLTAEE